MASRPIDTRLLRSFVTLARERNMSRAADKLFLTQPAVSLQMKELQALVGLELFTRNSHGVTPTRDGLALLTHAEKVLEGLDDFAAAASRLSNRVGGRLRIGTILDPEFTRLGAFLDELVRHAPDVRPELHHGMSGTTLRKLVDGDIDGGYFIGEIASGGLVERAAGHRRVRVQSEALTRFSYRVIAPPGWAAQVIGQSWAGLVRLPWIMTPPESAHARLLDAVLAPLGLQQHGVAWVDQEASMLALVRSGVGLALARDTVALQSRQRDGLVIADQVELPTQLSFLTRTSAARSPVVDAALEAVRRTWRRSAN